MTLTIEDARKIQNELRHKVRLQNDFGIIRTIAGIDVGYDVVNNKSRAAIVVIDAQSLQPMDSQISYLDTDFPYVPGFLSFREIPVILQTLALLKIKPDLLIVDGQGIAHPRRLCIAAHLGVATDQPSIGVAKSILTGRYTEPGLHKGDQSLLTDKGDIIGTVLRSRDNVKPLFISPGHRIDHKTSVAITLQCLTKYRLPEPMRLADKLSKHVKASSSAF